MKRPVFPTSLTWAASIPTIIDPRGAKGKEFADIAIFPWVRNLVGFYGAGDLAGIAEYPHVTRALEDFLTRPAVVKGLTIPKRP